MVGLVAIMITILVVAKEGRHEAKWVFGHFEPQSGWPDGWSFCIGLLQAAYATSATGMIISYVSFVFRVYRHRLDIENEMLTNT